MHICSSKRDAPSVWIREDNASDIDADTLLTVLVRNELCDTAGSRQGIYRIERNIKWSND